MNDYVKAIEDNLEWWVQKAVALEKENKLLQEKLTEAMNLMLRYKEEVEELGERLDQYEE